MASWRAPGTYHLINMAAVGQVTDGAVVTITVP